jgi:HemY protein
MKSLLWLLVVAGAAVALAVLGRADSGYVLFFYPPWRVEMSMVFFAIAAVASFAALYLLLRLLGAALSLPATVRAWRLRRRRERAHAALAAALQAYYEGRYARAEKEAAIAFESGPNRGVAALLAARAAHQMRDFERRDRWLERADGLGEALQAARLVSRAELALEDRDFAAAREALRNLHGAGPKHVATTRMLLRAERGAGAWDEVLRLASQLAQHRCGRPRAAAYCRRRRAACDRARHGGTRARNPGKRARRRMGATARRALW